jgi:hypothetical protein
LFIVIEAVGPLGPNLLVQIVEELWSAANPSGEAFWPSCCCCITQDGGITWKRCRDLKACSSSLYKPPSVGKLIGVPDHYTTRELRLPFVTNLVRSWWWCKLWCSKWGFNKAERPQTESRCLFDDWEVSKRNVWFWSAVRHPANGSLFCKSTWSWRVSTKMREVSCFITRTSFRMNIIVIK